MPENDNKSLGLTIANLRKARGYSNVDIASKSGIHESTLRRIQRGASVPRSTTAKELQKLLPEASTFIAMYKNRAFKTPAQGTFGEFLRERREDLNLTVSELIELTDIDQSRISAYELNRSQPSSENLEILMVELGFTPEDPDQVAVNKGRPKKTT